MTEEYSNKPIISGTMIFIIFVTLLVAAVCIGTYTEHLGQKFSEDFEARYPIIMSFSITKNFGKLVSFPQKTKNTDFFNGIIVICLLWLSLSNTFLYFANAPLTNSSIIIDMVKDLSHKFQTSAVYAFDIFFVIFGFTLAFTTLPKLKISVVKPLTSQILRVVPVYYFVLFFYITAFSRMGLGPAWPLQDYYSSETCENY